MRYPNCLLPSIPSKLLHITLRVTEVKVQNPEIYVTMQLGKRSVKEILFKFKNQF